MRLCHRSIGSALALLVLSAGFATRASGEDEPTSADVFDDTTVHELRLAMHSGDWGQLQAHYLENTFYPVDVTWNGYTVRNAGVRSRGRAAATRASQGCASRSTSTSTTRRLPA